MEEKRKTNDNIIMVQVKNVKGTAQEDKYIIWIEGYKRLQNVPKCCPACGTSRNDLVGAHVYKVGNPATQYIVPLCPTCNNYTNEKKMTVNENYLIPKVTVAMAWVDILMEFIDSFSEK